MNKKTAVNMGLESLALALIVTPEPVSTVLGLSLLGYTRLSGNHKEAPRIHRKDDFNDLYAYKIDLVNKAKINYEIYPTRPGQLISDWPNVANLRDRPELYKYLHSKSSNIKPVAPLGLQPAGLLGAPRSKSSYKFIAPKKSTSQK